MKFALIVLLFVGSTQIRASATKKPLVGRWKSDLQPTGYVIIDRYSDGRFAEKEFLSYDLNKPSVICITWGKWKLGHSKYLQEIEGSTFPWVAKFSGKWLGQDVVKIGSDRIVLMTSDGYTVGQIPFPENRPLAEVPIDIPRGLTGINRQVILTSLQSVPAWIKRP
jgi:hypothetical protein